MKFRLEVKGETSILLSDNIDYICTRIMNPGKSGAKSTETMVGLIILGNFTTDTSSPYANSIMELVRWSLIPTTNNNCYRHVTIEAIYENQVIRKMELSDAFIIDYVESYEETDGTNTFILVIGQKKDKNDRIKISGWCELEDEY